MNKVYTLQKHLSFITRYSGTTLTAGKLLTAFLVGFLPKNRFQKLRQKEIEISLKNIHRSTFRIFLRRCDYFILYEIFGLDIYRTFVEQIPSDGTILDLGGHIGLASLYIRAHCDNPIEVYEPSVHNSSLLQQNIRDLPLITLHRKAVSDHEGVMTLHIYPDTPSRNSLIPESGSRKTITQDTEVSSLDSILSSIQHCAGIKFDIEGEEYNIFRASRKAQEVPLLIGELKGTEAEVREQFVPLFPNHTATLVEVTSSITTITLTLPFAQRKQVD